MSLVGMSWIGAFAIGLSLGLLGSGGSILTVPVLVYMVGVPEKIAIAESLAIVGLIALGGALPKARQSLVDWRVVALFGVPGMAGSFLGAWFAAFLSGAFQLFVFALIMLVASYLMIRPPRLSADGDEEGSEPRRHWRIGIDGLVVGIVTGLVGVGGGFLIVPALVLLGGLPIHRAVGTSLAIIALKSATGFVKYQDVLADLGWTVDWWRIGTFAVVGFAGSVLGNSISGRLPRPILQRAFGVFLVVMALLILWQEAPALLA